MRFRSLQVAGPLFLVVSCGQSARIEYRGGTTIGVIKHSTPSHVVVDAVQGQGRVPRAEVFEIDHPGNVAAIGGLLLAGWGFLGLISPSSVGCEGEQSQFCGIITLPAAAAGIGLFSYGAWTWSSSVIAASRPAEATPTALSHVAGLRVGAGFSF